MSGRYLVDGYCLDESVAFKLYFSKLSPVVQNNALSFPELSGSHLTFAGVQVDLSAYLQPCDGDFIAAARSDFEPFQYVLFAILALLVLIRIVGFVNSNQRGTDE